MARSSMMIVVMIMMVVVVMVVMMIVPVTMRVGRRNVGAALGIERRLDGDDFSAEAREQRLDRGIAPHAQAIGKKLHWHVTVAEMPGESCERREILGARLDQRLGRGYYFDEVAVIEQQQIAHAQRDRLREGEHHARPPHSP